MSESSLVTALIVGLLGGVHCLGMCGGVVGALTFGLKADIQRSRFRVLKFQIAYNLGRILSYTLIGAIFGFLGSSLMTLDGLLPIQITLQVFAGGLMVALGLYLAGWWNGVVVIERLGQSLWSKLKPRVQKYSMVETYSQAWIYGFLWGWLPCGLVYSMLIMAMSAGDFVQGAFIMLSFGLGTLPNLLLMGAFAFYFTRLARSLWIRRFAGLTVILFGLWELYSALGLKVN
ncbi:sulfite exporter TauE/SafE family protein [Thiomicrorhabdus sp.]|uniref:sulfite exporter TauE/SafE family protein n=1 Tax=Thiomicrorhabdus sp. TaxID=2039724 RepID=UPI0029C62B24|nr:sulfite exporter TauE/SafE family protein [Thiomicrorhabdus sp.]